MNWNPSDWNGPAWVETPAGALLADIKSFFDPDFTQGRYEALPPEVRKQLCRLTERIELIEHLLAITAKLREHQTYRIEDTRLDDKRVKRTRVYSVKLWGRDFAGADHDIDALAVYLLLSSIDTIKGQPSYMDPFDWLKERTQPSTTPNWQELKNLYRKQYGPSRLFSQAFCDDLDDRTRASLVENLAVVRLNAGSVAAESAKAWEKRTPETKVARIASALYEMRSAFTHSGLRTFSPDSPISGLPAHDDHVLLRRVNGPRLTEMLRTIIVHLTIRVLNNATERAS